MKSDVILLTCKFEKFSKVSIIEFDNNLLYSMSLSACTWQCGLKYSSKNLETLQDIDLILLLENKITGALGSVLSDFYVKSDGNKGILYFDCIFYIDTQSLNLYLMMKLNLIEKLN